MVPRAGLIWEVMRLIDRPGRGDTETFHDPVANIQKYSWQFAQESMEIDRSGGFESVECDELGSKAAEGVCYWG